MIPFHLKIDFYFGKMVGVRGGEKMGCSDMWALRLWDCSTSQNVCLHIFSLRCVYGTACDSKNKLLRLPPVNGRSLNNGSFLSGKQMFSFLKTGGWQNNSSHDEL